MTIVPFHLEFRTTAAPGFPRGRIWRFQKQQPLRLMTPDGNFHEPKEALKRFLPHFRRFDQFGSALMVHSMTIHREEFLLPNWAPTDVGQFRRAEGQDHYSLRWNPDLLAQLLELEAKVFTPTLLTSLRLASRDSQYPRHPLGWQMHLEVEFGL